MQIVRLVFLNKLFKHIRMCGTVLAQNCSHVKLIHAAKWVCAVLVLLKTSLVLAQSAAEPLYFAGPSFISAPEQIQQRFPLLASAVEFNDKKSSQFSEYVASQLNTVSLKNFRVISFDNKRELGNIRSGQAKSLSFAFSGENVEFQRFENKYLAIYTVTAQVLLFDFSEKKRLLAAYPVSISYTDMTNAKPTTAEQVNVFSDMLFGKNGKPNLTDAWVRRLGMLDIKFSDQLVQIGQLTIEPLAKTVMPPDLDYQGYEAAVTQFVESTISQQLGLPIIPFQVGDAIQSKMTACFENAEVYDIELPPPVFRINIALRGFKKMKEDMGSAERVAYGAFVRFGVTSVALGDAIADLNLRKVALTTQPKSFGIQVDDWPQYEKTLLLLLSETAREIRTLDSTWLADAASAQGAKEQFAKVRSRFQIQ